MAARKPIDYSIYLNKMFNSLEVIGTDKNERGRTLFICQCKCGVIKKYAVAEVKNNLVKSCGCERYNTVTKHGLRYTRLYRIWLAMKNRCINPNFILREYYLDKGITVCDEWKDDFVSFHTWAINNGYTDQLTLDRIKGNLGYFPGNCRWATRKQQCENRAKRSCHKK